MKNKVFVKYIGYRKYSFSGLLNGMSSFSNLFYFLGSVKESKK